jgi:hypothetical protein
VIPRVNSWTARACARIDLRWLPGAARAGSGGIALPAHRPGPGSHSPRGRGSIGGAWPGASFGKQATPTSEVNRGMPGWSVYAEMTSRVRRIDPSVTLQ